MRRMISAAVLCLGLLSTPVVAQEVVGSSAVAGRPVELLSNFTWRYREAATVPATGCRSVAETVQFCSAGSLWQYSPSQADETAHRSVFRYDDRNYGMLIPETFGAADGVTLDTMRRVVIQNAAEAGGIAPNQVPVLETSNAPVQGQAATTVVYLASIDGVSYVFANTVVITRRVSTQIVTYSIGSAYDTSARRIHEDFVSRVRIN